MIGRSQTTPTPSPSAPRNTGPNGEFDPSSVGSGSSSSSSSSGLYLGWGNDFADQTPVGQGYGSYVTYATPRRYSRTDAKKHPFLTDPTSGSYKRLQLYYSQLPAEAKSKWKSMSSYWNWAVDLTAAGPISKPNQDGIGGGVWQTPWDIMGDLAGLNPELQKEIFKSLGARGSGGGGGGNPGGTFVDRQVKLTDAKTGRAIVNQVYMGLLGREATDKEAAAYLRGLHSEERANPTVTTTVVSPGGKTQSSTSKGGTNAQEVAVETAQEKPEYDRWQAESTYLDAFYSALGSPGGM